MAEKKTKLNILLALLIVLILAVGVVFFFFEKKNTVQEKPGTESLALTTKTRKEEINHYRLTIEYPYFPSASKEFNQGVETAVNNRVDEFKKNVAENWQLRQKDFASVKTPYTLNITWSADQLNSKFLSFILRINSFEGGANEIQDITTYNFDLVNKKSVNLSDLFKNDPNYLNTLSSYLSNDLLGQISADQNAIAKDMIISGTKPKEENFNKFTFNDNAVTFYFSKGQVAPAFLGEQKATMPRK